MSEESAIRLLDRLKGRMLTIGRPDKTKSDYTINFVAKDGRKVMVGVSATAAPCRAGSEAWHFTTRESQAQGDVATFAAADAVLRSRRCGRYVI